ncbi:LexA family protein [Paenibacillus xanthanilyticus]|uniref:LexA repressor DNA-binding domain-containing protein n=1 Tax=Paenibacillus xanthanilyticus TaxID=1783531 RepID=A0ABV8KAF0_9BACL
MSKLSKKQQEVLEIIKRKISSTGQAPLLTEIAEELGVESTATALSHVQKLEAKGYIKRDKTGRRQVITVLDPVLDAPASAVTEAVSD